MTNPAPTVPGKVVIDSVTPGDKSATVSFETPDDNGSPITSYHVRTNLGQSTDALESPVTLIGLVNGEPYTITVRASNEAGDGPESDPSAQVVPCAVPSPPGFLTASAGDSESAVQFRASADNGSPVTAYTVTLTPQDNSTPQITATGPASPLTVSGLKNGTTYDIMITAENAVGTSGPSAPRASITPVGTVPETPYQPFPDCAKFTLAKVINQPQLNDEMNTAFGTTVQMTVTYDTMGMPGTQTDGTLWVVPSTVDRTKVQAVVDAHVPDPNWGIPPAVQDYRAVLAKVQANSQVVLTDAEMQTAVKGLLVRMSHVN